MTYGDNIRKLLEPFNTSLKENDMEIVFHGNEPDPVFNTSVHIRMQSKVNKKPYDIFLDVDTVLTAPDAVLKELIALRKRSEVKSNER